MKFLRNYLNSLDVSNKAIAQVICFLIPSACPFARTLQILNRKIVIPPLCKLNPVYDELMKLRFKALGVIHD